MPVLEDGSAAEATTTPITATGEQYQVTTGEEMWATDEPYVFFVLLYGISDTKAVKHSFFFLFSAFRLFGRGK